MKVRRLIELLENIDGDRAVVMSQDGEGNSFSPLHSIETCAYAADTTWRGEVGPEVLTKEDRERGYGDEDIVDGVPALCLWPTN